jgi:cell division protein FtsL
MRRVPRQHRNTDVRRERDGRALRRQIVLLACGLTAACGFVAAVGQHYAAVRYGYEGERLREERKRLLAERDRLLLELSAAESPTTLERSARRIGMQPARPSQMGAARREGEEAGQQQSRAAADERTSTAYVRGNLKRNEESKRREEKKAATEPAARRVTRERVATRGAGDSRPRVVGPADAADR